MIEVGGRIDRVLVVVEGRPTVEPESGYLAGERVAVPAATIHLAGSSFAVNCIVGVSRRTAHRGALLQVSTHSQFIVGTRRAFDGEHVPSGVLRWGIRVRVIGGRCRTRTVVGDGTDVRSAILAYHGSAGRVDRTIAYHTSIGVDQSKAVATVLTGFDTTSLDHDPGALTDLDGRAPVRTPDNTHVSNRAIVWRVGRVGPASGVFGEKAPYPIDVAPDSGVRDFEPTDIRRRYHAATRV